MTVPDLDDNIKIEPFPDEKAQLTLFGAMVDFNFQLKNCTSSLMLYQAHLAYIVGMAQIDNKNCLLDRL